MIMESLGALGKWLWGYLVDSEITRLYRSLRQHTDLGSGPQSERAGRSRFEHAPLRSQPKALPKIEEAFLGERGVRVS